MLRCKSATNRHISPPRAVQTHMRPRFPSCAANSVCNAYYLMKISIGGSTAFEQEARRSEIAAEDNTAVQVDL